MSMMWIIAAASVAAVTPAGVAAGADGAQPGVKSIYQMGACMVRADRQAAVSLLRSLPVTETEVDVDGANLGKAAKCLRGGPLRVSAVLVRGGISQALLLRDFPRAGFQPEVPNHMFAALDLPLEARAGVEEKTVALYKLADCVVRNQAVKTDGLFRSEPGSGLESRLIDYFGPTMAACRGASSTLRIKRDRFRSYMAQAAYHASVRYWNGELRSAGLR